MANKQTARRRFLFKPLCFLIFVSDEGTIKVPAEFVTPEKVGEKAFGLSCLPKPWTLPFIVVSDKLLSLYNSCHESNRDQLLTRWAMHIIEAALAAGIKDQDPIIVRSSGCSEGLEERGKFYSSNGTLNSIFQPLKECLQKIVSDRGLDNEKIPLVIQKYVLTFSAKGHLSNERRFYEEKRDWLGEFEETRTGKGTFQINIRNWRKKIIIGNQANEPLECNLTAHISEVLKFPAVWAYEQGLRLHLEWVWDGKTIYLVQADQEYESYGVDPTITHQLQSSLSSDFTPKCLKVINEDHAIRYNKIRNVFTYIKLGLPFTKLYVLDDQSVINDLASGQVSSDLEADLFKLVKASLVIRMDIATDEQNELQLLPRTNEVRELDSAIAWLKESAGIKRRAINDEVVFIFHNFVPAISSAFAYAAPGERMVQIEALWGLPEGLYYNAHDKYTVDTKNPCGGELHHDDIERFEVRVKRFCKHFFVAPDVDGRWTTKVLKPPYDWRESIQKQEWVKEIALESRRIAEEEKKSLSIMWFVGVPSEVCSMPIFPWFHEFYDPTITSRAVTRRTKTPFDKSLIISTNKDVEELRQEAKTTHSSVRRIRIQPREEALLRDKNTLRVIGELAQKIGAIILLEGGVLSHAYYQLMQTKAIVEVCHPFGDFENKQEFNKLVRDKVPSNIEHGGEVVSKTRLSGEALLRALREKLIEEAFEVLDAIDQDSIVGELADIVEIIDEILCQLGVGRDELQKRQDKKRERTGGFQDGLVLLETKNPLLTKRGIDADALFPDLSLKDTKDSFHIDVREVIELSRTLGKWSDRREHQAATETILKLVVPMTRDSWAANTPEIVTKSESDNIVHAKAKITGKRSGANLQISLSIFTPQRQLKLF